MSAILPFDGIPAGQHTPFARISDDDHRAWILIISAIGVAFVLVTTVTRIFIRWFGSLDWALDDTVSMLMTVWNLQPS